MKIRLPHYLLILFITILFFRLLYPYTRLAHTESLSRVGTVRLNRDELELSIGETFSLHLIGTWNRRCSYESTDFKVAFVGPTGKVTALRKGMAIIRAVQKDQVYTCRVRVISAPQ